MKRSLWLLMLFLLAGHVPAASADSACEGRFVNPITDICWSCIFPLSLGSIKVSQGKVPDTANPSMPIQICPAPPPLFWRIGLAIGYWEPMALTDVTRSPGCMVISSQSPADKYDLINKTSRVSPDSGRFYEPDTVLDHRERVRLFIQIQFPHGSDWSEVLRLTDIVTEKVSSGRAAGGYHHRHKGYTWSVSVN